MLKIDADNLTAVEFGDSDRLKVGDYALAIGNPFGLGQTGTSGIISALGRSGLGIEGYEDFIQTDASINPRQFRGGALVDLRGQLIGINTAILGPSGGNIGIGFAVPANIAKQIMSDLVKSGDVKRGQIGIRTQDLTPDIASSLGIDRGDGALIAQVAGGSSAADAGLQAGDLIVGNRRRADPQRGRPSSKDRLRTYRRRAGSDRVAGGATGDGEGADRGYALVSSAGSAAVAAVELDGFAAGSQYGRGCARQLQSRLAGRPSANWTLWATSPHFHETMSPLSLPGDGSAGPALAVKVSFLTVNVQDGLPSHSFTTSSFTFLRSMA